MIDRYCELHGIGPIDNWHFYLVFSFFRLAAILQGVLKRALEGNASGNQAMTVGKMTGPLTAMWLDVIENKG